jgi:hypothetical protein
VQTDPGGGAIARIAFVTRHFDGLRGLITASFGAGLILAAFAEQASGTAGRWPYRGLQPLLFANLVMVLAFAPLDRGYRQTFGHPVATARQRGTSGLFCAVVLMGGMIDGFAPRSISCMSVGLAIYAAWMVVRDWPWRIYYAAAVAVGLLTAAGSAFDSSAQATLNAYSMIGLAMMIAGGGDHRQLVSALAGSASPRSEPAPGRRRALERVTISMLLATAGIALIITDEHIAPLLASLVMFSGLVGIQILLAVPAAVRAIREYRSDGRVTPPTGPDLDVGDQPLLLVIVAAAAAAAETAFALRGLLAFTVAAIGASSAIRVRPVRLRYLAISVVFVVCGLIGRQAEPIQAFGMLLIAAGAALMLAGVARHSHETSHADTI